TPFNAVIGFSSIMKSQTFGPLANTKYQEYIDHIHASGKHLLSIINDILDLSRIEASQYDFNIHEIEAAAVMNEVAESLEAIALAKQIRILKPETAPPVRVAADERALRQVLM